MDKLVKIIILIIGLSAAFLWMSKSLSSCNGISSSSKTDTMDGEQNENAEEVFEGDDIDYSTSDVNDEPIEEEIIEDTKTDGNTAGTVDFTEPASVTTSKPTVSRGTSSGSHLIIAGNYLLKSNAEIMTVKLKDLGYRDAYIAVFDNSQYHTVIAGTYNAYEPASNSAAALKRQGVDCYVKKKK